jgi:predicted PurR-regulated permease PerM
MGTSAGISLWIMGSLGVFPDGKTYAVVFGAWYGFAELIPYVGPAIGAAPPVLIALFSGNALDALWLTLMFIALQQIEGHIVAPTVFSQALRINPILVILALLIGGRLYGFAGAFISLPIAAVLRETVVYLRRHLVLEPWGTAAPVGVGVMGAAAPTRCAECGAHAPPGAAFCPSCGAELDEADAAAAAAAPS